MNLLVKGSFQIIRKIQLIEFLSIMGNTMLNG